MSEAVRIAIQNLTVSYGGAAVLRGVTLDVSAREILGVIGPAGSGKSVFLRAINRLNALERNCRVEGRILLDGEDIYSPEHDVIALRRRVGMVFALPVALPMSIADNVTYGPRLFGSGRRGPFGGIVERSLRAAFLWEEVKDRLNMSALRLSGGQQQRLCLARTLAMEPEVVLLDEPCSGLDPISTAKIEEALIGLKENHTIVLVTNNTKQAARVADRTVFFLMGEVIEAGPTDRIFTAPADRRTNDYVSGRFG